MMNQMNHNSQMSGYTTPALKVVTLSCVRVIAASNEGSERLDGTWEEEE